MIQHLRLQGHTSRLNELLGHWAKAARLKRRDREWLMLECKSQGIVPATGKRRVSLLVTMGPKKRSPDRDAWWKALLDALVHAGTLIDDSPRWCVPGEVEYERGESNAMTIILEDV